MSDDYTCFHRDDIPADRLKVYDWRRHSRSTGCMGNWRTAARRYARESTEGRAMVLLTDGTMIVYTRQGDDVERTAHKPGRWIWVGPR